MKRRKPRCVKCDSTDIQTSWHVGGYYSISHGCAYNERNDPGTSVEHLHRTCRVCGYGWGDAIREASDDRRA